MIHYKLLIYLLDLKVGDTTYENIRARKARIAEMARHARREEEFEAAEIYAKAGEFLAGNKRKQRIVETFQSVVNGRKNRTYAINYIVLLHLLLEAE